MWNFLLYLRFIDFVLIGKRRHRRFLRSHQHRFEDFILFERSVGFYASLVNVNAYHQPGVEAGKKAAGEFLDLLQKVRQHLESNAGEAATADQVASAINLDPESVYHALSHLAATRSGITKTPATSPADEGFTASS